jgi:peptidoglycan biosynthesis protein MviN/MurJ (putative lipid II flippase)
VLFGHGGFPANDLPVLADTLGIFVAGVPTYVAGLTYTRAFLASKRSGWLVNVVIIEVMLKLALNGPLMRHFGVPGLAAATSVMYAAGLVLLVVGLHRTGWPSGVRRSQIH